VKNNLTEESFGFIGLGVMGAPMAKNLLDAGYNLRLFSRSGVPELLRHPKAEECQHVADVADGCSIVFLMLPDTSNVEAVLFGDASLSTTLKKDQIIVDLSSISPEATRRFAEKVKALGAHYLDAPVSGGEVGARDASLSIFVGGETSVFARVLPILQSMGSNINLIGDVGAGQIAKLCNQIIVALNIEAVAEGLVFAKRSGVDPSVVRSALAGGFASSRALEIHGDRMISREFDPGFRIELHQKDLNIALNFAKQQGIALPNVVTTQRLFSAAASHIGSDRDHSAIVTAVENMANTS